MWDLTVPADHDFYIQAGTTAILVHNCGATPRFAVESNGVATDVDSEAGLRPSADSNRMDILLERRSI
jgi:hypothetical protein